MKSNHQSASSLLESALTESQSGVLVYQALRNTSGTLTDLRLTMLNAIAQRDLGRPATDLLGLPFGRLFPDADEAGLISRYRQVIDTGKSDHFEFQLTRPGQLDPVWLDISAVQMEDNVVVSYTDITQVKLDTEIARKQTALLQDILEGVPVGIAVLSAIRRVEGTTQHIADFRVVRVNSVLQKAMSRSVVDMVDEPMTVVFDNARESGLLSRCILSVGLRQTQEFEMPYSQNGHTNWFRVSIAPTGDQLILAFTDITETKRAQLAHHRQAELLQSISDNTPAGLVLWEAVYDDTPERNVIDFRYLMTNHMNTFVTGYSADVLVGQRLLEMFPRFRGTEMETVLREVFATGSTQRMIFTYYTDRPDGWFDAQFIRVGKEVLMTFMDVTVQHKIQLNQKKQSDFVQAVINAQPVGVAVFDPIWTQPTDNQPARAIDFTLALANETVLKMVGLPTNKVIGQRLKSLCNNGDSLTFFEFLTNVAETGQPTEWLLPYTINSTRGWLQSSLIRQGDQVFFTFLDVSELKQQQQALEVANLELRRSNDNLQQFAYIASHDLQEPLRKIQSFGNILAADYAAVLDETAQSMISRMQGAAVRMSGLIKDLLDYSRISTRQAPFILIPLSTLLTDTLADLFVAVNESAAMIEWGDLPIVYGDKSQLRQLFQNLLSNAIKFRAPGVAPKITISCRNVEHKNLPIGVALSMVTEVGTAPSFYEINLSDNGIGFDEKYLDQIFQVFQRLHGRNEYPGTGVGLAICRKVAENHRGALTATSQPGAGATFSLYLPVIETP